MTKIQQFSELLEKMQSDIRLEVILGDLISDGLSMEEVVVMSESLFKRGFHHDIERTGEIEYEYTKKKKLFFAVNREGIYDRLPQDLFHQPSEAKNLPDKDQVIQEIKVQNELEKAARLFFQPIEHEFFRLRVKLELEERAFLFETNSDLSGELFNHLWDLPDFLDNLQKSKLGVIMPVLNKITGNAALAAFIIERITNDQIEMTPVDAAEQPQQEAPILGKMTLGADGILGGLILDLQNSYILRITPSDATSPEDYLPGGKKIIVHEFLYNLLMPFENEVSFELNFADTYTTFTLGDEPIYSSKLNYTTII